ncbi:MAG: hypothetical protein JXB29_04915 [Sedimentisphaerales bacterium]|nr:hypothetical protein [Sedimentisphaerales bacterium]
MHKTSGIFGNVELTPAWFQATYGLQEPNPFETDIDELVEHTIKKNKLLYERFPELPLGEREPQPSCPILLYDRRIVIAAAYGESAFVWNAQTASFWVDKNFGPWKGFNDVSSVLKVEVPDWENVGLVQEMLAKWEQVREKTDDSIYDNAIEWLDFDWQNPYTGRKYRFSDDASFIDLGLFLCGSTEFFTILAAGPQLAQAMLEKCFELSTSYSSFLRGVFNRQKVTAFSSLGGDNSCNLSGQMYRQYAMAYDAMRVKRYGNLPCNLHSCGPSSHLYEVWSTYPNRDNIVLMQTRGIPGQLHKLKKALPNTFLQITIHQPQFDFENESPENIQKIVEHYAKEAGYQNLELVVVVNQATEKVDRNIRSFYEVIGQINSQLLQS